ncbi:hypothetical protein Acr_03g0018170 [Actinidia rufa]|uniref:Reverse transcriptase zinc-binding domain-containing protein n=1 Tax=Actinidia rufa TaxID=165716 RepID=A0A7J0EF10_9ERIC|nr:hypothetical protein Acr_03g0018170 [Actinidia rufa]
MVKSAYFSACHDQFQNCLVTPADLSSGSKFWALQIPPKYSLFIWKAIHHILAVKVSLLRRNIMAEAACPICSLPEESIEHLLFSCPQARLFWRASPLGLHFELLLMEFSVPRRMSLRQLVRTNSWLHHGVVRSASGPATAASNPDIIPKNLGGCYFPVALYGALAWVVSFPVALRGHQGPEVCSHIRQQKWKLCQGY